MLGKFVSDGPEPSFTDATGSFQLGDLDPNDPSLAVVVLVSKLDGNGQMLMIPFKQRQDKTPMYMIEVKEPGPLKDILDQPYGR